MGANLQEMIAEANARAGRSRQKACAKRQHYLQTDRQALEMVCQRVEEFVNCKGSVTESLKAMTEAVKLARKHLEGKGR